jgi:hypothetical protein
MRREGTHPRGAADGIRRARFHDFHHMFQIRGRESVQLGMIGSAGPRALPELSNSPTTWFVVGGGENLGQDEKRRC